MIVSAAQALAIQRDDEHPRARGARWRDRGSLPRGRDHDRSRARSRAPTLAPAQPPASRQNARELVIAIRRGSANADRRRRAPRRVRPVVAGRRAPHVPRRSAAAHPRRRHRRQADRATSSPTATGRATSAQADSLFVNAGTWGLMLTGRSCAPAEVAGSDRQLIARLVARARRAGACAPRCARRCASSAEQFVMGRDHRGRAERRAARREPQLPLLLRHARRSGAHRRRCASATSTPTTTRSTPCGRSAGDRGVAAPSISIKLSALHPRYECAQRRVRAS